MELTTTRLRLDALRENDADMLFHYRSDPEVARYQGWRPVSRDEASDFIASQERASLDIPDSWLQFAIRLSTDGTLIGDLGLHIPAEADGSYEFGITIAPVHQGNGYAREAVQALLTWLFLTLDARRVHASIDPRNLASAALLRSLGMRQEAHFRESLKVGDEWVDDVIFALLAREWALTDTGR
ncbi:GNAT family N-acetyltransferase [Dyella caseinilytica]|uniref:GNAT family N-acetyltransferase n=1 Tax=Dyella caseinilytica TaxID=1849581 RepID=A0ABX7GP98_9GAMM|nr:GNAT family protein [Dyella caseinilytica]QRN52176.1 GNAT family N-acetyltransferase [Dyella caseinilytica]GGA13894.1 N-acetyltransferase [Dyella caseinilytica]